MEMDASAYIAEQIPLLSKLHAQLALPPTALADDTARIDAAVRAAIVSVVRSREDEVAVWEGRIADGKRALASLARAIGERGRSVMNANRRDSETKEPLPAQHAQLVTQTEELEQVYRQRLKHAEDLHATIERLSILLGPPFDPPAPLMPIPGQAVPARAEPPQPQPHPSRAGPRQSMAASAYPPVSGAHIAPTINKRLSGRRTTLGAAQAVLEPPKPETWFDVGEDVFDKLQARVDAGMAERDSRLRELESTFNDLIWYRAELDLPALDGAFPPELRPPTSEEEVPGAHRKYEELLEHVVSLNPIRVGQEEVEGEEEEIQGMDKVEPEVGLMRWAEEMLNLWVEEKEARDERIQELYEKIEPLWVRLEIEEEYIDEFTERNRGSGLPSIQAYEEELERVLEIRKTSLSSFVVGVRKEIEALQDALLLSDDEKAEFGAFIDDEYTEELLSAHEAEAERLRAQVESCGVHLARVKEWIALKADEEQLELSAADPNRFKKRGTQMLQEERMRKRVEKRKPKLEADLLATLPAWEEENGRPFLARGERVVDVIEDAIAAKEAAKEAKKRAKMGLAPSAPPASKVRATPAAATRSQPGTLRKRPGPAPTPCPPGGGKRPRTGASVPSSTRSIPSSSMPGSSRSVSGSTARSVSGMSAASGMGRTVSNGTVNSLRRVEETPTATAARRFGAPATGRANTLVPKRREDKSECSDVFKTPGRPRGPRKSFKPRQSIAGGLLAGRFVVDEMDEADYDDVF